MSEIEFKMPRMGESITEGTIINWLVKEGETFDEGDILVEVATDKVDNEVPAPFSGKMLQHKVSAKDIIPVGDVIAVLEVSDTNSGKSKDTASATPKTPLKPQGGSFRVNENVFISPLVDTIARKNHISYEELARISGTGKMEGFAKVTLLITSTKDDPLSSRRLLLKFQDLWYRI